MSAKQLESARKLIHQGRYQDARNILRQLDDPTAAQWLDSLTGKQDKPDGGHPEERLLYLMVAVTGFIALLLMGGLALVMVILHQSRESAKDLAIINNEYLRQMEWEDMYASSISLCSAVNGDAGETCRTWADMLLNDYYAAAQGCLPDYNPLDGIRNGAILICLYEAGVPAPHSD